MQSMFCYRKAAVERAMKVQEVILRAMAKKITWWQAAEIIGISDRQMRRWRERYEGFGFRGLFDRRRGEAVAQAGGRVANICGGSIAWVASEGKEVRGVRHFSRFSRKLALSESPKGGPAEPSTPFGSALPGRRPDSSSSALPTESSHPASDHPHRHPTRHARE